MASKVFSALTERAICVVGLPWITGSKELMNYFQQFGPVIKSNVVFDRDTGLNKGYGFVYFENPESIQTVFQKQDHLIDGKKVKIMKKVK